MVHENILIMFQNVPEEITFYKVENPSEYYIKMCEKNHNKIVNIDDLDDEDIEFILNSVDEKMYDGITEIDMNNPINLIGEGIDTIYIFGFAL